MGQFEEYQKLQNKKQFMEEQTQRGLAEKEEERFRTDSVRVDQKFDVTDDAVAVQRQYYFEDEDMLEAKITRYKKLQGGDGGKVAKFAAAHTNRSARKRKKSAGKAAKTFRTVQKMERALKEDPPADKHDMYLEQKKIMGVRLEAMIHAAKAKASSPDDEAYRIAKARYTTLKVLVNQMEKLKNRNNSAQFKGDKEALYRELAQASVELNKHVPLKDSYVKSYEKLKASPNCPANFTEQSYGMYKAFAATNQQIHHPVLRNLINNSEKISGVRGANTFHGHQMEISRIVGGILRTVHYNEKWEPLTEEDKINHEWNLKLCENIQKGAAKDADADKAATDMVNKEISKVYPMDFELPDPSVFDEFLDCLEKKKPVHCEYIEKLISDPQKYADIAQRNLCYSNMKKAFPDAIAKVESEHKGTEAQMDAIGRIGMLVSGYCSLKYGLNPNAGNNIAPDGIGHEMANDPELAKAYVNEYKKFLGDFGAKEGA